MLILKRYVERGDQALKLVLKGLKGGHSGDEIGELETLREDYKGIEDDISFSVTETDDLPKVVSPEEKENTIDFMTEARDRLFGMETL